MNTVFNRPLFRAGGGPVSNQAMSESDPAFNPQSMEMAAMAEQGMVPGVDPAEAMEVNYAEGDAFAQGESMGKLYMAEQQQALDAAETPEDVINAIRGTEEPLEARYAELAAMVGEEDAGATPETVLMLVQPAIMMTEEGAVNSGLGQLMQGVLADSGEMEDESGPTDLGQGVGGLMMQGAGNTPPANFNQGGPVVRHFNEGGGAEAVQLASDMLPAYQEFLGVDKDASRASALFAISRAAANWASGMGPGGQDLRGLSPGAQFAANLGGLAGDLEKIAGSAAEKKQQLKMLALQRAQGKLDKEDERKFQILMADKEIAAADKRQIRDIENQLALKTIDVNLTREMKESDQSFTRDQTERAFQIDKDLQMLAARNDEAAQILRSKLEEEKIRLQADLTQRRDAILNEYNIAINEDNQTAAENLARLQAELRDISTVINYAEQKKTQEALKKIDQEYKVVNYGIELDNALELQGVRTADELTKMAAAQDYTVANMETQNEFNVALENTKSSLRIKEQNDAQAHDLAKQAIQNAFASDEADKKIAAQKILTQMQLDFQGDENEKSRAAQLAQNMINNAFKEDELLLAQQRLGLEEDRIAIQQGQLDLAVVSEAATQTYRNATLALDREKAKLDNLGKTLDERLLNTIVRDENVEALKTNGDVSTYFAQLEKFILPSTDASGATKDGLSIPEKVKAALRDRADKGLPMPDWLMPSMYGAQPTNEELLNVSQNLIKPDVDLRKATGYISGLASVFNYIGESTVGELTGTSGTMFAGVKQAQGALDSLNAAHRRFILEGRQLATELNLTLGELPEASFIATDAGTAKKIENQLNLLKDNIARLEEGLTSPEYRLSKSDASKARQLLSYARQLQAADEAALASYRGETTRASGSIFDTKYKKGGDQ